MWKKIFLFALTTGVIVSCNTPEEKTKVPDKPVALKKEISIHRYEQALFNIPPAQLRHGIGKIYPGFMFFLGNDWQDTLNMLRIYNFVTDPNIREINNLVQKEYPETNFIQSGLKQIFDKVAVYYPEVKYPLVYTYVSGLDIQIPVLYVDTAMAVSLDLFLGAGAEVYTKAGIPAYLSSRYNKDELLPACIRAISDSFIVADENKQSLIDLMIKAGKALYFMDKLLPDTRDEYKIGYSAEKLSWCTSNESNIWAFLVANQLLFSSDPKVIGKLMVDAPYTSGFEQDSPGRIGEWVGWQIVKAYMNANPTVKLDELLRNTDSQSILEGSHYKPRK